MAGGDSEVVQLAEVVATSRVVVEVESQLDRLDKSVAELVIRSDVDLVRAALARAPNVTTVELFGSDDEIDLVCQVLTEAKALRVVRVSGAHGLTDRGVALLAGIEGITHLDLPYARRLTALAMYQLAGASTLKGLGLRYAEAVPVEAFVELAKLEGLEDLDLARTQAGGETFQALSGLKSLRSLRIGGFSTKGGQWIDPDLTALPRFNGLKSLHVEASTFEPKQMASICACAELEELVLDERGMVTLQPDFFEGLSRLKHLRVLSIESFSDLTAAHVASTAKCTGIETLDVCGAVKQLQLLKGLLTSLPKLTSFTCGAFDSASDVIDTILLAKKLQSLTLYECFWITDEDVARLAGGLPLAGC